MQENPDQKASSQDEAHDLRTSLGEVVRRVDLRFVHDNPSIAGHEGVRLAWAALTGDQEALDEFHDLVGLALPVTEHGRGDAVRVVLRRIDRKVPGLEVDGRSVHQAGEFRAVFRVMGQVDDSDTSIDAAEIVAWILSSEGRTALAHRGVVVPVLATDGPFPVGVNVAEPLQRDRKLLALLDAARELAAVAGWGPQFRANALDALEAAALAWTVDECPICGRRGDHEWEEMTFNEKLEHRAEDASQGR